MKASPELLGQLSDIDKLLAQSEKGEFTGYFDRELTARAIAGPGGASGGAGQPTPLEKALKEKRTQIFADGQRALEKLRDDPGADLTPTEELGLEAIAFVARRPAILVQNGEFVAQLVPSGWEVLNQLKDGINQRMLSIGRINVSGHPKKAPYVGTGFVVAKDVVMTNRHVAVTFCQRQADGTYAFKPGMSANINFREQLDRVAETQFKVLEVIGIHEDYDLALLRVETISQEGAVLPPSLWLASGPPSAFDNRQVYVCGYPAWDGKRNDREVMREIFGDVFGVKRLQPGQVRELRPEDDDTMAPCLDTKDKGVTLVHDCSTLGGNSGSPVIDLETDLVIGLHRCGVYMAANQAVALWRLTEDPLLKKAEVNFD